MVFGADRTVKVVIEAVVTGYIANMKRAQIATTDFGKSAIESGAKNRRAFEQVGQGALLSGGVIAVGLGLAIKAYADFDQALSNVRAVSNATAAQMTALSKAALAAGEKTKFSATQAAQAEAELAKVGISVADIIGGGLTGALDLAAAGNLDLATAAKYSGQAMKIFKLEGKDIPAIADALALGATNSAADVTDLGMALSQAGLVAQQTGIGMLDTVGTLAAFADNALIGSDAGTSFKTMLQNLNPRSKEAAALMEELGITAFDAQGEFIGITEYAGRLQTGLGGLSTEQRNAALNIVFGSDAIRAATVLYDQGAQGLSGYIEGVSGVGAASRIAAVQTDNLKGDLEKLKGAIESALIQTGSAGNDALRSLTQTATDAVGAFNAMPESLQNATFGVGAVAAAALLLSGGLLTVIPKIAETKKSLDVLGISAARTSKAFSILGAAGIALVGLSFLPDLMTKLEKSLGHIPDSSNALALSLLELGENGQASGELVKAFGEDFQGVSKRLEADGYSLSEAIQSQTGAWDKYIPALEGGSLAAKKSIEEIDKALAFLAASNGIDAANTAFDNLTSSAGLSKKEIEKFQSILPQYSEALAGASVQTSIGSKQTDEYGQALSDTQVAARELSSQVTEMAEAVQDASAQVLDARAATRKWEQALDDARQTVKENGKTLDVHTQKGRDNQAALDDVAQAALDQAKAVFESTRATKGDSAAQNAMRSSLLKSRDSLIRTAMQFGLSRSAAIKYADSVLKIPSARKTSVTVDTSAAEQRAINLRREIESIRNRTVTIDVYTSGIAKQNLGLLGVKRATGGIIPKAWSAGPSADDVPALLSGGEYVVKASSVDKYGAAFFDSLNAGRFADGGLVGRAMNRTTTSSVASVDRSITFNGPLQALDVDQLAGTVMNRIRQADAMQVSY